MWAASNGHLAVVQCLQQMGAEMNAKNQVRVMLFFFFFAEVGGENTCGKN